jgi:hypothetical protein
VAPSPWTLVWFAAEAWPNGEPPASPPPAAELSPDKAWASVYAGSRPTATWTRTLGLSEREIRDLKETAELRSTRRRPADKV